MRKNYLLVLMLFLHWTASISQNSYIQRVEQYRDSINRAFSDSMTSILPDEERASFTSLDFFPPDEKFRIPAKFTPAKKKVYFEMLTTTSRKPIYYTYGWLDFSIDDKSFRLAVYKPKDPKPGYENWLFCPFTDLTNGEETYGGGRYLDFTVEDLQNPVIDFNYCYNPYCAYNPRYSCPVPPKENFLNIRIEAGVKKYHP